jgi:hypothetical protein
MTNLKTNPSPRPNLGLLTIANEFIDFLAIYFNFSPEHSTPLPIVQLEFLDFG